MKPIEFDQCNVNVAESQPEYGTVPCHIDRDQGVLTSCWELTEEEIEQVKESGVIFFQQWTFGRPMQPVRFITENPLL